MAKTSLFLANNVTRVLDHLYEAYEDLGNENSLLAHDELMNLEFVKAFGVCDFIEASSDNPVILGKFFTSCISLNKALNISDTTCYESCSSESHDEEFFFDFAWISRFCAEHPRRKKRMCAIKSRSHTVALGSNIVYLKDGTVARNKGYIYRKFEIAKIALASENAIVNKGTDPLRLKHPIHSKSVEDVVGPAIKHSIRDEYIRIVRRSKRYVKLARMYKDYDVFYRGRYFKNSYEKKGDPTQLKVSAEVHSTSQLQPVSRKESYFRNVIWSTRHLNVFPINMKVPTEYGKHSVKNFYLHFAAHTDLRFVPTPLYPHLFSGKLL